MLANSMMFRSGGRETTVTDGQPSFLLQVRNNVMETILIVLLVVFLLGGGGWGYRRWRG